MDKLVLTYKLKAIQSNDDIDRVWFPIAETYNECYNKFSHFIADNIDTMTFGEIASLIDGGSDSGYRRTVSHQANSGLSLYRLFSKQPIPMCFVEKKDDTDGTKYYEEKPNKKLGTKTVYNIAYELYKKVVLCDCNPRIGIFTETEFHRFGVCHCLVDNLRSYFTNEKLRVAKRNINEDSTEEEKLLQVAYEITKDGSLSSEKGWKEKTKYFRERGYNDKLVDRFETLSECFKRNQTTMDTYMEELALRQIRERFSGPNRTSRTIVFNSFKGKTLSKGKEPMTLEMSFSGDKGKLALMGHRKLMSPEGNLIFEPKLCESISFQFEDGKDGRKEMYVLTQMVRNDIIPQTDGIEDEVELDNATVVGCDINTKHLLMVTSLKDNGHMDGYVNLFSRIIGNRKAADRLREIHGKQAFESLTQLAGYVTFGMIESDLLHSRSYDAENPTEEHAKLLEAEKSLTDAMRETMEEYQYGAERTYIGNCIALRNGISAYHRLCNAFDRERAKYDEETYHSIEDCDETLVTINGIPYTKGTDFVKKHPFVETEKGREIMDKRNAVVNRIRGVRDSIVQYAYNVLLRHGARLLCMEDLDSSQFEKYNPGATAISLLRKHKLAGKTTEEALACKAYAAHREYYKTVTDDNGKITDIIYSDTGMFRFDKALFSNRLIKAVGFASVKDELAKPAATRTLKTAQVPAMYSSQMDSVKHVLLVKRNEKGKETFARKNEVRKSQETHVNGLNADVNSALNLEHMAKDAKFRSLFLAKPDKREYATPAFIPKFKSQIQFLKTVRKENLCEQLPETPEERRFFGKERTASI